MDALGKRSLLDAWYEAHPYSLTQHHLQSFDHFVETRLQATIQTMNNGFVKMKKLNGTNIMADDNKKNLTAETMFEVHVFVGGRQGTAWYLDKPTLPNGQLMYPNNARMTGANYASVLYADVLLEYRRNGKVTSSREFLRMRIGTIPIMLHSSMCVLHDQAPQTVIEMGECPFDQGGYFIIGGKEKVILAQERIAYNRLFVTVVNPNTPDAKVFSHDAFIRCLPPDDLFPRLFRFKVHAKSHKRHSAIVCWMPRMGDNIPLFVIFRALGVESDEDILRMILGSSSVDEATIRPEDAQIISFLRDTVVDCGRQGIYTQTKALELFAARAGVKNIRQVKDMLVKLILPNAGKDLEDKAVYLGYLVKRLVRVCIGVLPATVRDSWVHKRMDLSGILVADLFRDVYRRFRVAVGYAIDMELTTGPWRHSGNFEQMINASNFKRIFDSTLIDRGMISSFKGAWNAYNREGVVQDLNRQSYQTYMSHVRRVSTVMGREVKLVAPHLLYAAPWGAVCPVDSPDGANVGLLKHFAIMCHLTCDRIPDTLGAHLRSIDLVLQQPPVTIPGRVTRLFLNHSLAGITHRPVDLVRYVRLLRRTGLVAPDVSVSWDVFGWEINILTDGGRTCRPLICLADDGIKRAMAPTMTSWARLISGTLLEDKSSLPQEFSGGDACAEPSVMSQHCARSLEDLTETMARLSLHAAPIELIDTEELNYILVSNGLSDPTTAHTHCEIHPATMFSHLTATIPLMDHNPAAYNSLCVAQTKQGLGAYVTNFMNRMDVSGMVLHSTQLPLVTSYFADKISRGENLVVAIANYGGYNQEDAIILNKSSAQRGMFNVSVFATDTFKEEMDSWDDGSTRVIFANPMQLASTGVMVDGIKADRADYSTLTQDGTPEIGARIAENRAIVGMCVFERVSDTEERVTDKTAVADRTQWGHVDRVYMTEGPLGTRTCKVRMREVRMPDLGDKLASRYGQKGVVGMLLPQTDMPFSSGGIVPDIIINPNGFPKRMTVGHVLEALLGRVSCDLGRRVDATSFEGTDPIGAATSYFMSRPHGEEWTTNGDTVLYNGRTGHQMDTQIFVGVNYYNRLKHMAIDKINYRSTGPRNFTTHQPTQGRGNAGGLKLGEMEQHCMLSHGAASFLKESFFERSDGFHVGIDERAGIRAQHGTQLPAGVSAVVQTPMPYSFKQMSQELEHMAIDMKIRI
ncbi:DNA-directed RNA polymerase II subunit RPB2 [Tetrabaena socialis]|uniref:DNA-directed RNA polymerase n=1 Tax=Tetrabaena socialis TaxID=47790 RepID=A0A2J8AJ95_9CHLO|nr:DNA-directed RNA polymerase II subunit RPB2 [Tetrabaena socialis]|eukprot:PNH12589.1 DNA-directed RNA polymerase II subunit RPB2 [Tetrabaena socialis]